MKKDTDIIINEDYRKNNFLIGSAYKSTLLENKIMAVALANIKNARIEEDGTVVSVIRAKDMIRLMNANRGSFYTQLESTANSMRSHSIGMRDPEKGYFDYITLITRTTYEDGDFRIEWNRHLKPYLKDISTPFTVLNINTMLSFKTVYSFRLYEILKSQAFKSKYKSTKVENEFIIEYSIAELKLHLGVVNAEEPGVQKALKKQREPNFEKAVEVAQDRMYETWKDFRTKVLDVACKEISEKTDMNISYEPIKSGRGQRVRAINFFVRYKKDSEPPEDKDKGKGTSSSVPDAVKFEVVAKVARLIKEILSTDDILAICEAASYEYEKIEKIYELAQDSEKINSLVGFMISGIKNDYKKTALQGQKKKPSYKDFEQRTYDFDELEKELLNRS